MSTPDPSQVLQRLAEPDLRGDEAAEWLAALDGHEAEAALPVFRQLHDAKGGAELHAAVSILAHWSGRPVARALAPALRTLLAEPAVGDLNKLAAADLLAAYGEPLDRGDLAAALRDPAELARRATRSALEAVANPLALVNFLDALATEPQDLVLALIEDLVAVEDLAATAILAPLAQAADADLAISAVVALEELGLEAGLEPAALEALMLVARHHPDETAREQADLALGHLQPALPRASTGLARPYLSRPQVDGSQLVALLRGTARSAGLLTLVHDAVSGVLRYAVVDGLADEAVQELLARLGADLPGLAPASAVAAREALEAASARTLSSGGASALGYAAWPWVLGPS